MPRTAILATLLALALSGCGSDSTSAPLGPQSTRSPLPNLAASTGTSPGTTEPKTDVLSAAPSVSDGLRFTDGAGTNCVVLRRRENDEGGASLLADHVVYPNSQKRIVLREVRDGVPDCDLHMVADFVARSLRVADSDGDSLAGVSFAYRRNCADDVGPEVQKLLVLEGGEKYILRGSSFSQFTVFQDPEPDPSQDSWPGSACNDELERFCGFAVQ